MARRATLLLQIGLVALGLLCWTLPGKAYEDQASLDVSSGVTATASTDRLKRAGPEFAIGGTVGLTSSLFVRGQASYLPLFDAGHVRHVGRMRAEGGYRLDVLKVVPFVGLGANLWIYRFEHRVHARPGVHALLGVDYLWSRALTVGLDLRTGLLVEPGGKLGAAFEAQVRLSRMFDMF